jgi:hypothetical protein
MKRLWDWFMGNTPTPPARPHDPYSDPEWQRKRAESNAYYERQYAKAARDQVTYDAHFRDLPDHEFHNLNNSWDNRRDYMDSRKAYESAQRTKERGIQVTYGKHRNAYYVWTNNRGNA